MTDICESKEVADVFGIAAATWMSSSAKLSAGGESVLGGASIPHDRCIRSYVRRPRKWGSQA